MHPLLQTIYPFIILKGFLWDRVGKGNNQYTVFLPMSTDNILDTAKVTYVPITLWTKSVFFDETEQLTQMTQQ